jgi:aspartate carbamoyltransferase catalytic subunit
MIEPIKNLLAASDLPPEQIHFLLGVARTFSAQLKPGETVPLLKGLNIVNLFFENSTRTRTSFELAIRRLEGSTLNFAAASSSVQKGETLIDTARNIEAMRGHCLIVRHSSAGSPHVLARALRIPVINAGDGFHEHPTQGLLDAYTMEEKLGSLRNKRVVIVGDIAHSRVARSNIHILKKLGASVAVCGPPTLLPPHPETLGVDVAYRIESLLPTADVVMALRIQMERQNRMQIPSVSEYSRVWGLNQERAKLLKKGAIILHPGPINRGVEIDPEVADSPRSVILDQVSNGILVRMAVLAHVCNPQGLAQWLEKGGHRV